MITFNYIIASGCLESAGWIFVAQK